MNTKIKLLLRLILVTSIFTLYSCEKDLYEEAAYQSKIKLEKVSLSNTSNKKNINPKLLKAMDKAGILYKKSTSSKIIYDDINNIYFDDEKGIKITKEDYESYTFKILNENAKLENLLFSKNQLQEFDIYKVKYDFTEEELQTLNPEILIRKQKEYIEIINGRMTLPKFLCVESMELVDNGDNVGADSSLNHAWVSTDSDCYMIGGGDDVGPETGNNTNSNTSESGSTYTGGIHGGVYGGGDSSTSPSSNTNNSTQNSSETQILTTPVIGSIADIQQSYQELINLITFPLTPQQSSYLQLTPQHNLVIAMIAMIQNDQNEGVDDSGMVNWLINQGINQGSNSVVPTINYFNNNYYTYISIKDYLTQNNFNSQSCSLTNQIINGVINGSVSNFFADEMFETLANNGNVDYPKKIIYAINKPCQKQIIKDILDTCSPFTQLMQQTFNSTDNVNIKFYNGEIPTGDPALTNAVFEGNSQNFTIKIKLDNNFLDNATNLSIITVTLHELTHAYLTSLYLHGQLVATNSDYNTLLNAFITFYDNQTQDTLNPLDNEIHNAMKNFIEQMANSIYTYSLNNNIQGVTPDYCLELAWGSMYGTNLFTQVLTPEQQQNYGNTAATEQDHLSGHKGSTCN